MNPIESLILEYKKFRKNNIIFILLIFFLIFLPATMSFYNGVFVEQQGPMANMLPQQEDYFGFPGIWEYMGYNGSWLAFFFLGATSIFLFTSEVRYKTLRQGVINGQSRQDFFMNKMILITVIAAVASLYFLLCTLLIGGIFTGGIEGAFDNGWATLRFFLLCMSYMSFGFLAGVFFKRSGLAIFLYMTYVLLIETLLKWGAISYLKIGKVANFLPMNATEDLAPAPWHKTAENLPMKVMDFTFLLTNTEAIISTSIYIVIFVAISYYLVIKRDM